VGPENDLVRADVIQKFCDRARVGVCLEKKVLLLREGDHLLHDGEGYLSHVEVKLTEPPVHPRAVRGLDVGDDRAVPGPREDIGPSAIWSEHRHDADSNTTATSKSRTITL